MLKPQDYKLSPTDTEHNGWVHHEGILDKVLDVKRSSLWD